MKKEELENMLVELNEENEELKGVVSLYKEENEDLKENITGLEEQLNNFEDLNIESEEEVVNLKIKIRNFEGELSTYEELIKLYKKAGKEKERRKALILFIMESDKPNTVDEDELLEDIEKWLCIKPAAIKWNYSDMLNNA